MTAEELKCQRDKYLKKAIVLMLNGSNYGQAMGNPSILQQPESEFRREIADASNDLSKLIKLVHVFLDDWFEKGEYPPPYYATRIAILLRKAKRKDLEISFLKSYCKHFRSKTKSVASRRLTERAEQIGAIK